MDQLNPRARSDEYGSRINRAHSPVLVHTIPPLTIILGSILPLFAIAGAVPIIPPLGFLILLAWRISRPGLFVVWIGLPLGLIDDLFSGQPFGSAVLLWSLAMIVIEMIEVRFPWRTYVQDWLIVCGIMTAYLLVAAVLSGASLTLPGLVALGPQLLMSILIFPIIGRIVARLDRLRLTRFRAVG